MADKEKGKVWYKIMIDFDEEIKKFQPSLEVDEIEAEAISEDLTDLSDLLKDILDTTR